MANTDEESNPLLSTQQQTLDGAEIPTPVKSKAEIPTPAKSMDTEHGVAYGWTADGVPIDHVIGATTQWDSSLLACLGRHDHFCSSDLEVCLLGSVAPCMLYGTNAERLGSAPGTFANHCLTYTGLYLIGNSFFGWNCLAPWFSYPSRTAIRQKFNLEGSCEALNRSCGCCGSCMEDELQKEQCESGCDFATHVFCHPCALCQEGRELRRRMPHPGFNAQPAMVMSPPGGQTMGRGSA